MHLIPNSNGNLVPATRIEPKELAKRLVRKLKAKGKRKMLMSKEDVKDEAGLMALHATYVERTNDELLDRGHHLTPVKRVTDHGRKDVVEYLLQRVDDLDEYNIARWND